MTDTGTTVAMCTAPDGARLAFDDSGGDGPAVVFVPSLGRGAPDFASLAGSLAAAGYRTVCVHPRGTGASDPARGGRDLHAVAADVAAVVDAIGGRAHLVGHAFGNRVVRCTATDRPDAVASVTVLACGGLVEPEPEVWAALGRCVDETLSEDERREALAIAMFAPGNDVSAFLDGWSRDTARAQSAATRATPVEEWWEAGRAPVLIIQGLQDRCAVPENGRRLADVLAERATLVEIEGAGHALLPEQPEAILEAMLEFLAKV